MVRTLEPRAAETLLASGAFDIVDVRDPRDWASGHIPGARNVVLDELRGDPKNKLPRDRILFVCARGIRSLSAAKVAEDLGFSDICSLEGGILAWASLGLPLEATAEAAPEAQAAASENSAALDASCGLPEPGLDAVVGKNLRALRDERSLSLDALARLTGLSRTVLGQIELGKSAPSVGVVWKIARAFDVHFSALLATSERSEISVLRGAAAKRLVSPDGRFSSRALFPLGNNPDAEFYELYLGPHSREDAQPHQPGTQENLVVAAGRLELYVDGKRFELGKGDAIVFQADVPHSYANPDKEACWMYLVMTYARTASGPDGTR
jgi:rhodanese-related sulfurtransferase/transcriptional regulator with XRE-family HTH domain